MQIIWWKGCDLSLNHNMYLWISLGNSFFSEENIIKLLDFSLKNSKSKKIVILIADSIQIFNYIWIKKVSLEKAQDLVTKASQQKKYEIENIVQKFFSKENIEIIFWDDISKTFEYTQQRNILQAEYDKKEKFYQEITNFVIEYIVWIWRTPNKRAVENSVQYILSELPFILGWIEWKNEYYTAYVYPSVWVWKLMVNIQNWTFPELLEKLNLKNLAIQIIYHHETNLR